MTASRPEASAHDALALLTRLLALAAHGDERALGDAVAAGARELLREPEAAVVPATEAGPDAIALPGTPWVLVLPRPHGDAADLARAIAATGAAAFQHLEERRRGELEAALGRAAQALHDSLDLSDMLTRICREAAALGHADAAAVLRAEGDELVVEAAHGLAPEAIGWRATGDGFAGRALAGGAPVSTDDPALPPVPWGEVGAAVAVPIDWGNRLRGVLVAAHRHPDTLAAAREEALAAFAKVAGAAFANAAAHTGLALSLRTDPLTGCLNHAALHDGLRREVERAERSGGGVLSLILLDLERLRDADHDPLADEVLRRAGHALRSTTRPYDLAARYGGTEFALVAVEADEQQACEVAARAVARLTDALADVGGGGATAGVAQWHPGMTAGDLVARADRALTYGRRSDRRGEVLTEADLPATFLPGRGRRRERRLPVASTTPSWAPAAGDALEPLRARIRKLALAGDLGPRLAGLADAEAILAEAIDRLADMFPGARVTVAHGGDPAPGALTAPIAPAGELRVEGEVEEGDERVLETVAAQLRAAEHRARLTNAYLAAADALAADAPATTVTGRAVEAGRRLGLDADQLRALALAAALATPPATHDDALARAEALVEDASEPWTTLPLPARILAAALVDPATRAAGAGTRFDPAVVEVLGVIGT